MTTTASRSDLISQLTPVKGVGKATAESVVDAFDADAERLLSATEEELTEVNGVGTTTARALRKRIRLLNRYGLQTPIEALQHDEKRSNIPTDQLSQLVATEDGESPDLALYPRDPELDPQLVWEGKGEQDAEDLSVPISPVYIQEKIVPEAIIENLRDRSSKADQQTSLFEDFDGLPEDALFDFYEHKANWSNRMILGDALVAMTSLAEKENLKGKVQTIYVDPPYGISFQSNWQVSTRSTKVKDGKDITRQPEQVQAYRDTWKNGIHSYLTYLRDRLQVAHTLLNDSGSIFVQIGDENVHAVRSLLDEVFGPDQFVAQIAVKRTTGERTKTMPHVHDYILWYARDKDRMKMRKLWRKKELGDPEADQYNRVELPSGEVRTLTEEERAGIDSLPKGALPFRLTDLTSASPGSRYKVEFEGETYEPPPGRYWSTNREGMERLRAAGRLVAPADRLYYKRYLADFNLSPLLDIWTDTVVSGYSREDAKRYVVQTATKVVRRCILMTSDPGDLVLDPTCGSGTTAYVAEKWGRRWITIDTSRVALAIARGRIMGARYPYWYLSDSPEGARIEAEELGRPPVEPTGGFGGDLQKGFVYRRGRHVRVSTIASCEDIQSGMSRSEAEAAIRREADSEILYDRPYEDGNRIRVAGPFTVESLSPHRKIDETLSASVREERSSEVEGGSDKQRAQYTTGSDDFGETVIENLQRAGVQNGYRDERLEFDTLEPYPDGAWIAAHGTYTDEGGEQRLAAISIGPEKGTVGRKQVNQAAREGVRIGADLVLVCGFAFDGGATEEAEDASQRNFPVVGDRTVGQVRVLNVRINADLMMDEELKTTGTGNLFMVFGEPDIDLSYTEDERIVVSLNGVDVYDPVENVVRSSGPEQAMAWFIDTDYDESQFFVRHAYFTGDAEKYDPYSQLKRALDSEIDEWAWDKLHSTESMPFEKPSTGKFAVKVINHYGDEVVKVFSVE